MSLSRFGLFSQVHCEDDEIGRMLRDDIEFFKKLFSFTEKDSFADIKKFFFSYIKKRKNTSFTAFISILKFYFIIRPLQFNIMQQLLVSIIQYFPKNQREIQSFIKKEFTFNLFNVIKDLYDEKTNSFRDFESSEVFFKRTFFERDSLFDILQNDDVDDFIDYLVDNPNIDINGDHMIPRDSYMSCLPDFYGKKIKLIDFCCYFGATQCFKYLSMNNCQLSQNISPNYAIAGGSYEIVQIINQQNISFKNCLEDSIKYHRYEFSDWIILNFDTDPIQPANCINYYNYEAFLFDMNNKFFDEQTFDENKNHSSSVNTELHIACRDGMLSIVRYLIEKEHYDPNIKGFQGNSPLYYACTRGHLDIVKYLIETANADKEQLDDGGNTPLLESVIAGQLEVTKYLIEQANVNKDAVGFCQRTALHYACAGGHLNIVKYLVEEAGLEKEPKDAYGLLPINFAILNSFLPVIKYLIEVAGIDKDAKNEEGDTLLHYACQYQFLPIIKYLIVKNKAAINAQNEFGCTPLHFAAASLNYSISKYLIAKGADTHIKDMCGKTPYDDAINSSKQCGKNVTWLNILK